MQRSKKLVVEKKTSILFVKIGIEHVLKILFIEESHQMFLSPLWPSQATFRFANIEEDEEDKFTLS